MKVYFNGSCNICNAEISHYKKKTININYVDISKNNLSFAPELSLTGSVGKSLESSRTIERKDNY